MAGRQEEFFFLPEIFDYEPRVIQITDNDIAKVLEDDNFLLHAEEASDERS